MRILFGIAAALLFTATAVQAEDKPAEGKDKPICKRVYEADTGSHFTSSKRVCRTALEWKELEGETQRTMQRLRDNGGASPRTQAGVGGPG